MFSSVNNQVLQIFSVPVKDEKNKPAGVVCAVLKGDRLNDAISKIDIGAGYNPIIINRKTGAVIANPNKNSSSFENTKEISQNSEFGNAIKEVDSGTTGTIIFSDSRYNQKMAASYRPVSNASLDDVGNDLNASIRETNASIDEIIENIKKVYCIDTGLAKNISISAGKDLGRLFENAVFGRIRRETKNIWYYSEAGFECDFLYGSSVVPEKAVQVCYELTNENLEREARGLVETMKKFPDLEGKIVTLNQNDKISYDGKIIEVIDARTFFG